MLSKLRSFFQRKDYNLTDPGALAIFGIMPTASGVSVTAANALRVPAVNAAVRVIGESIASLPLKIYRRTADGGKETAPDHPAYRLVHDEPNPWSSSFDLRLQLQTDCLLHGNAFALISRSSDDRVLEVIRLDPGSVSVEATDDGPRYRVSSNDGQSVYGYSEVLHIKGLSTDGVKGVAPIFHAREAIGLALTLEAHAARLFGNGARPSGLLKTPGKLSPEGAKRIAASWRAAHGGENSGATAVLEEGVDWQSITLTSVDAQYLEQRKFAIEEISRAFRVPPHLLSELGRATWGNASEMGQSFLDYTMLPWLVQWQGALTRTILNPDERAEYIIEFDTSALTRANIQVRFAAYRQAIDGGFMVPNEIRAAENLPALPGGDNLRPAPNAPAPANDNIPTKEAAA